MIFSIRNINTREYLDLSNISELIFDATLYSIEDLIKLYKDYEKTRIVYDLSKVADISKIIVDIKDLPLIIKGMSFRTSTLADLDLLLENGLPVFCGPNEASNADSLDKMVSLCEKGVTDVYIAGQLGFEMEKVRKVADRFDVFTRVVPNMASLSGFTFSHIGLEENLTAFWIRPNDIDLYAPYIDIVEFFGVDEKQAVFFDIYSKEKEWKGELGDIIAGLNDISNKGLIEDFTKARLNCGKKCILDQCHSCFKYKILGNEISKNDLKIEV